MCVTEVRVVWFMLTTSYNTAKLITLTVIDVWYWLSSYVHMYIARSCVIIFYYFEASLTPTNQPYPALFIS